MRTRLAAAAAALLLVAGCGSDPAPAPNAADRSFLQQMIPHHERAIEAARLGVTRAADPRVRAFALRIVREQTPELAGLRAAARGERLDYAAGAAMAAHRIGDADLAELRRLSGTAFDRRFLALHVTSETGAAEMARAELRAGRSPAAEKLAGRIANAPSEIRELRALLARL